MNLPAKKKKHADTLDDVYKRLDAKLAALGSDCNKVAEPPGGAEKPLSDFKVLVDWVCKPGACAQCKALAAGGPYDDTIPTWPGDKGTCGKKCKCSIQPNGAIWQEQFGKSG